MNVVQLQAMREEFEKEAEKRKKKSVLRGALTGAGLGLVPGLSSVALTASSSRSPKDFLKSMALQGATGAVVGGGIGALGTHASNKYPSKRKETEKTAESWQDYKSYATTQETGKPPRGISVIRRLGPGGGSITVRKNGQEVYTRFIDRKLKTASWAKDDLPWYTTAAGATAGTLAASKFVPKKYRAAGQIGGALLGTAAGLEGGKAVARRFDKTAAGGGSIVESLPEQGTQSPEDEGPLPSPPPVDMSQARKKLPPHPAVTAGKTLAGLGIGMGAGYAGMKGIDYALEKTRGHGLPSSKLMWAIPAATAALGMAYPYMHQATVDKMRKDYLDRQEAKRGR